jgi:tetratricopeptide (TPR) repeat protein
LSQQLLVLKDDLTDQQWARQAIIYQRTDQPAKAARAWQIASEKSPQNSAFKLSWAYSLIDIQKDRAFKIMKEVIDGNNMVDTRTLEQLGYLAAANQDHPAALEYITKSIVTDSEDPLPRGEELSWLLHEYHRDLSEYWRFSAIASQGTGGILGDVFFIGNDGEQLAEPPTNNITARAEYYFNPLTEKWSIYGQVAGNGDDNRPLNDWSIELGVSYKPFDDFNFKGTLGAQRFFSGDWEGLIRINGDLLNQGKWRQDWRFEESWWERQLYFDFLWLPESDQFLGTVRADFGHAYSLETNSKQTIKYYGLAQYDTRKPQKAINGSTSFNQTSVGLGIQWRLFTTPNSPFKPVHRYSLALEWRYKVSGELTNDDNSLFLIANYLY